MIQTHSATMHMGEHHSVPSGDSDSRGQADKFGIENKKTTANADFFSLKFLRATVILEYDPSLRAVLQFNDIANRTAGWLCSKLLKRLRALTSNPEIHSKIDSIVALKTKNQNLFHDVLLSMDDCSLSFLERETILVPYFGAKTRYCEESLTPLIGLEDFEIVKSLGYGGFSKVFLGNLSQYSR